MSIFKAYAYTNTSTGAVGGFNASVYCASETEARALAAMFPKFVGVKVNGLSGAPGFTHIVSIRVYLSAVKGNAANETGVKRIRKFLALANIEWVVQANNCYQTQTEFEGAL